MIGDELETSPPTLSPPHDGSEFELFPELQSSRKALCDCSVKLTDCCTSGELSNNGVILNANPRSVIRVKMTSSEEADFVNYLTGKKQDDDMPCLQVVRDLNHFPSYEPTVVTSSRSESLLKASATAQPMEDANTEDMRGSCMSKNAILAREHRLRKKMYHETLQTTNSNLTAENSNLKTKVGHLDNTVASLEQEVMYLKSVIANQGAISALLKNIHSTAGLHFNSGLTPTADSSDASSNAVVSPNASSGKRKLVPGANTEDAPPKRGRSAGRQIHNETDLNSNEVASEDAGGVCLHVKAGKVSLEFCADCSEKSKASWNKDNVLL